MRVHKKQLNQKSSALFWEVKQSAADLEFADISQVLNEIRQSFYFKHYVTEKKTMIHGMVKSVHFYNLQTQHVVFKVKIRFFET